MRVSERFCVSADQRAQDLQSLGVLYSEAGRYADAEKHFQLEVDVLEGGGNQSAIGRAYMSMAGVRQLEGAFAGAETSYKKAIDAFDLAGLNDKEEALALNGLGWLYTLWGKTGEADRFLQKAWNAAKKTLAPDDPSLIRFLDSQASYLTMVGKYSEAEKLWTRALQIGDKAYVGEESRFGEVFLHLGQLYAVLQDYESAEKMFRRFLALDKVANY